MKIVSKLATAIAALGLSAGVAFAEFPEKPITLVVSFAAGGNADVLARLEANALSEELGVPVTVINKLGGAHIPAVMSVLESPADGYTLLKWVPPSFMIVPLTRAVPYDPLEDFIPLLADGTSTNVLYVRKDSDLETFEQLIKAAEADKLSIGVNSFGAPANLSAVQLAKQFDIEFKTIALKTVPATMTGLIGGQVDVAVGQVASMTQFGDDVRPLVILDNARQDYFEAHLPGVPTVGEVFPGKEADVWIHGGLAIHADTPPEIVERLNKAVESALNTDAFLLSVPDTMTVVPVFGEDAVRALLQRGVDLYSPILDELGLLKK